MLECVLGECTTLGVDLVAGEYVCVEETKVVKKDCLVLFVKLCCDIKNCIDLFHLLKVAKDFRIQRVIIPSKIIILIMHSHDSNFQVWYVLK